MLLCSLQISLAGRMDVCNKWRSRAPTSGMGKPSGVFRHGDIEICNIRSASHSSLDNRSGPFLCCDDAICCGSCGTSRLTSMDIHGYWLHSITCCHMSYLRLCRWWLPAPWTVRRQWYRYPHIQLAVFLRTRLHFVNLALGAAPLLITE